MAVTRATTWTNNTVTAAFATPVRLKCAEVQGNPTQGAVAWLQIYNTSTPTLGVTAPDIVIPIFKPNVDDGSIRQKVDFSGMRLPTGFSWFVSAAANGSSNAPASAANAPLSVQIFYDPA